jgi:hypothetical protein
MMLYLNKTYTDPIDNPPETTSTLSLHDLHGEVIRQFQHQTQRKTQPGFGGMRFT